MIEAVTAKGDKLILLSEAEYRALTEDAADAALAADADGGPALPAALARRVLAGELHPLTAWRTASALPMAELAARAGVRAATISDIENGRIDPRYSTVQALASALELTPDAIMP